MLDRLSDLLRSALDEDTGGGVSHRRDQASDPDWRDAWAELDEYMRRATEPGGTQRGGQHGAGAGGRTYDAAAQLPAEIRRAYETLELAPGTSLAETRRRFRQELARYHPDHFAADPEKFAAATAVTRELIAAFRRIRDYYNAA